MATHASLLAPKTLLQERYQIVRLLAQGGMSAVYQATDLQPTENLGSTVALKQILVQDPEFIKAFERETRLLAGLKHPSLPMVGEHFVDSMGQFLVMQFVPGDDLGTMLDRKSSMFLSATMFPWVLRWADQLLDALVYLHSRKPPIIHRDIKPRNLKLTARGERIILLDFGLAKGRVEDSESLSEADLSVRAYTMQYSPLEQIQGTGTDARSDIYSLGATLYHLATGQMPPDSLSRTAAVLTNKPDPLRPAHELNPQVPSTFSFVLHQALAPAMAKRFATTGAMRAALHMAPSGGGKAASAEALNDITIVAAPAAATPAPKVAAITSPPSPATPITDSIGSVPTPLVVSKRGQGHYKTISEAIANAEPGTQIFVHPGLYKESLVLDRKVEIIGDGPLENIVVESTDANCLTMQTDYAIVRGLSLQCQTAQTDMEYFTVDIPKGRLLLEDCDITCQALAAIAIHGPLANPFIWRCSIHDSKGAGILIFDEARGILEGCDIFGNTIVGVAISLGSNPILRQCKIHHEEQDAITISERGEGIIEECEIFENKNTGIVIKRGSNPFIRRCNIHDQVEGYGITISDDGEGLIEKCDIFSNSKAGIEITQGGNPLIRNTKIHSEKQRGVLIWQEGHGTLEACQLSNNTKESICIGKKSDPVIRRCQIRDGKQRGILIWENSRGLIEDCTIVGNAHAGIEIRQASKPTIRRCLINRNNVVAILVRDSGAGEVEECDLTGNARGAWFVEPGCNVRRERNKE